MDTQACACKTLAALLQLLPERRDTDIMQGLSDSQTKCPDTTSNLNVSNGPLQNPVKVLAYVLETYRTTE